MGIGFLSGYLTENFLDIFLSISLILIIIGWHVKLKYNFTTYKKICTIYLGMTLHFLCNVIPSIDDNTILIIAIVYLLIASPYAIMIIIKSRIQYSEYQSYGHQPTKLSWDERNYFPSRRKDLKRIKQYLNDENIHIIGIEAEWGQGKTFVVQGLIEQLENDANGNAYEFVIIDLLAIRLDNFLEYMVSTLDDILYKNHYLSKYSRRLKSLFQNEKIDFFTPLWDESTASYEKTFKGFQEDLLRLEKKFIIIFEDIDRINDVERIKNILYLSEKLTSKNNEWKFSSIKIIYQYNAKHMKKIGLKSEYLEKYIQHRILLTKLSLIEIINAVQEHADIPENAKMTPDEIYRLPPYLIGCNIPTLIDMDKLKAYFQSITTVRITNNFLKEFQIIVEDYPYQLEQNERNVIIATLYIKYFMPSLYDEICQKSSLYQAFIIQNSNHQSRYIADWLSSNQDTISDLFDSQTNLRNFKKCIAFYLLGLDRIRNIHEGDYNSIGDDDD